jgi:SPP1 gp7 family putative phage head morphogenesis protein
VGRSPIAPTKDFGLEHVQNAEQNEADGVVVAAFHQAAPRLSEFSAALLDKIRSAKSPDEIKNLSIDLSPLADPLSLGVFNIHLIGRSQVWADFSDNPKSKIENPKSAVGRLAAVVLGEMDFQPLPFDEAINYFRSKTNLTPEEFRRLSEAARAKASTIAAGSSDYVRSSINDLLDQALADGMTLKDFQSQAADVLDSAGLSARTPWYWETVYRTNLQTSYQAGRWKQIADPAVAQARPYLRYVSALLPTTRPSHREKHGHVFPIDHPFWSRWYPPNGFNCYCTAMSVSPDLLMRRGWTVDAVESWVYPEPDEGFGGNAGKSAAV